MTVSAGQTSASGASRTDRPVICEPDAIRQSLASGHVGIALLELERARAGTAAWASAHAAIRAATTGPADGGAHTGLFYGAPALAFLLGQAAQADDRYHTAAATLDTHLARITQHRLTDATARIRHGGTASFAEYDLLYGLTGLGALLLQRMPGSDLIPDLLRYLIELTRPQDLDGLRLPGWWVNHDPDPTLPTPGGHANLGMAHGAAGILALLASAHRRGHTVDGHLDAIRRLTRVFDRWRQDDAGTVDPWWPQWLTLDDLDTGHTHQPEPNQPSWCYGTPGIARALQLAAIATDEHSRRVDAEQILADCLTDASVARLTGPGLCHGLAGLFQTAYRAAADATTDTIAERLPNLAEAVTRAAAAADGHTGLLTGHTGIALAAETAAHGTPTTGWDTCLLIT
ncbi:lanthionine synthetase C family protein [Dactylosporangium cerinum]|uniref:Lanthionine synthetase C family protein n=1 Tax=Dactylosporangium cerinum TaxID=1434730 RepID=A0ABV9WIG9_9ACTN